ncbi:peptidyl-prolyl cis-trans isomerase, partial [Hyphomicrobium sp.]
DPDFAGPDGSFSRQGFDALLRQMGLNEQGFIALRRDDELRRIISDALLGSTAVPKPMINDLHAWREETRTLEHVRVDPTKVTVAEPDEAALKTTYEQSGTEFMTPEYRNVALLLLSANELKGGIEISDAELESYYKDHKASYDRPERRRIQQIAFPDKATAAKAREELVAGTKNFTDVAKEQGATENDINLGLLSRDQMLDPVIADAAFKLERDEISEPVEGRFATVLVRVNEITKGKESTFAEVKDQARDRMAGEQAQSKIQEHFDLVEEGRNAGKTLQEIGEELKLRYIAADAVTADNLNAEGKTAIDIPDAATALRAVFAATPGMDTEPIEMPGGAFAWYDVLSVTERKQRPFEDVREDVKTAHIAAEKRRLLDELAGKLVDRLKAGEAFAKVAEDAGGNAERAEAVKRNHSPPGLTTDAVRLAFSLAKGGAGFAESSDRSTRVVFQVQEITPVAAPTEEETNRITAELSRDLANDDVLAYISALRSELNVSINETELARATGASETDQ